MQTNEAVSVLKNLSYRPGWSFDAIDLGGMDRAQRAIAEIMLSPDELSSIVLFRWVNETVDTDREYARNGYDKPKVLEQTIPLNVADVKSADDLLFMIFEMLMELELHESREFFRCKDRDYNAPFHPHKDEGDALWTKCVMNAETN